MTFLLLAALLGLATFYFVVSRNSDRSTQGKEL